MARHPGVLAPQHGLAGVHLGRPGPPGGRVRLSWLFEDGEGTEILGVVAVRHTRDLIILPVQVAGLYSRLEPTEYLNIAQLPWLGAGLTAAAPLV